MEIEGELFYLNCYWHSTSKDLLKLNISSFTYSTVQSTRGRGWCYLRSLINSGPVEREAFRCNAFGMGLTSAHSSLEILLERCLSVDLPRIRLGYVRKIYFVF